MELILSEIHIPVIYELQGNGRSTRSIKRGMQTDKKFAVIYKLDIVVMRRNVWFVDNCRYDESISNSAHSVQIPQSFSICCQVLGVKSRNCQSWTCGRLSCMDKIIIKIMIN